MREEIEQTPLGQFHPVCEGTIFFTESKQQERVGKKSGKESRT